LILKVLIFRNALFDFSFDFDKFFVRKLAFFLESDSLLLELCYHLFLLLVDAVKSETFSFEPFLVTFNLNHLFVVLAFMALSVSFVSEFLHIVLDRHHLLVEGHQKVFFVFFH